MPGKGHKARGTIRIGFLRHLVDVAFLTCVAGGSAWAQTVDQAATSPDRPLTIRWSFKGTTVLSEPSQAGLWRFRVEPTIRLNSRVTFETAYEQRVRVASVTDQLSGAGLSLLPAETPPPYRLAPLDWTIASGSTGAWRHEIDRAVVRADFSRVEVRAGRQAIGWGRGVLFAAIDLFAPFSPFEADREWRRGVDAVRVDARLSGRTSADVALAFGPRPESTVYVGRLRGYAGSIDLEVAGGRRGRDGFGGAASSFVVGPAEIHVEIAAFQTPAVEGSPLFDQPRTVVKGVLGGSSRLPIASGVALQVEYHYSGFGVRTPEAIKPALSDPAFLARLFRGDMQILTRHALALAVAYEWSPIVAASAAVIHAPLDGSGVVTPSLTLTFGDRWSLLATAYLAYGRGTTGTTMHSAYGATPTTALVQVRLYR